MAVIPVLSFKAVQLKLFMVLTKVLACCANPLPNEATDPDLLGVDLTVYIADMS